MAADHSNDEARKDPLSQSGSDQELKFKHTLDELREMAIKEIARIDGGKR